MKLGGSLCFSRVFPRDEVETLIGLVIVFRDYTNREVEMLLFLFFTAAISDGFLFV